MGGEHQHDIRYYDFLGAIPPLMFIMRSISSVVNDSTDRFFWVLVLCSLAVVYCCL